MLYPSLGPQRGVVLDALVTQWSSGTRDNYLQKFEVFLSWLAARNIRVFADVSHTTLLQFVFFLLDDNPYGEKRGLAPQSVLQYLSGVRTIGKQIKWDVPKPVFDQSAVV